MVYQRLISAANETFNLAELKDRTGAKTEHELFSKLLELVRDAEFRNGPIQSLPWEYVIGGRIFSLRAAKFSKAEDLGCEVDEVADSEVIEEVLLSLHNLEDTEDLYPKIVAVGTRFHLKTRPNEIKQFNIAPERRSNLSHHGVYTIPYPSGLATELVGLCIGEKISFTFGDQVFTGEIEFIEKINYTA